MTSAFKRAFDSHRNERADELYEIADILNRKGLASDTGPIFQAASQCRAEVQTVGHGQPDAGRQYWGFEISNLRINLEEQRHCRPRKAVMKEASGTLSVTVQEYVPDNQEQIGESYKLLKRLDTDFFFDAFREVDGTEHLLRAAWHLDTHLYTSTPTRVVHPRFHFQVGGEHLDDIDDDIRGVFMPEAPRMACAPLDAVLAVDFVLAHYCGESWHDLEPSYARLRKNPMQRYWSPYFRTLMEGIDDLDNDPGGGNACGLIPSIFVG